MFTRAKVLFVVIFAIAQFACEAGSSALCRAQKFLGPSSLLPANLVLEPTALT
jgi:hypothetical protein